MDNRAGPPRTLTQMLRDWDDGAVRELLLARPDLAFPLPTDFSQIASRATTRHSVGAALDSLTAFEVWVAQRASQFDANSSTVETSTTAFSLAELLASLDQPADAEAVESALRQLLSLSLLWGDTRSMRPVRAMTALLATNAADGGEAPPSTPPTFDDVERQSPALVDKVAAGSAFEFVRRIDVLVEHCDHRPARLLRTGGLSSRDIRGIAGLLDMPTALATTHLEIAQAAGLLGPAASDLDEMLIPTVGFDSWQSLSLADQWVHLAETWFERHAVSGSPDLKRLCVIAFGDPDEGRVLTADHIRRWLGWQRPRRAAATDRQAATMLDQAAWMGVTALGAVASFAVTLDQRRLSALLPDRVDHVLVQADLTAVAPGPLDPDVARDLGALAEVESRGGATVYRFTGASLQRARSLGWSVDDILATLTTRSRTPIPQALDYLVHDLARQPVGPRPAPNTAPRTLASADDAHRPPERARARPPSADVTPAERLTEDMIAESLRLLRHVDQPTTSASDRQPHAENFVVAPVDTLREAVETGEVVWFGYVDTRGTSGERLVRASAVDEGVLSAEDSVSLERLRVPLHRITAAHIIRGQS